MAKLLKKIVDQSPWLTHLKYFRGQSRYRLGLAAHYSGATHSRVDIEGSVRYIHAVAQDYLHYAGVDDDFLHGKRILEIGPGDNLGVGLLLLARGAASYVAVDRFQPQADDHKNQLIYRRLYDELSTAEKARTADVVKAANNGATLAGDRLSAHYNCSIEGLKERIAESEFDVILSRAVLEHVYDLDAAWENMVGLLSPTGQMWHKVDFRNHDFYNEFHPLRFLTVPRHIWRCVSQPDPTLNRHRLDKYKMLSDVHFQKIRIFYTHLLQHPELIPHPEAIELGREFEQSDWESVQAIRPKLTAEFDGLSDLELLVSGIFLICDGKKL